MRKGSTTPKPSENGVMTDYEARRRLQIKTGSGTSTLLRGGK